jgi:hypothetical protein
VRLKAKLGDIIEIPTAAGITYSQYTHQHGTHGGVLRIFDRVFDQRPTDFQSIAVAGTILDTISRARRR